VNVNHHRANTNPSRPCAALSIAPHAAAFAIAAGATALTHGTALADSGSLGARPNLWTAWSVEPSVLLALLLAASLYLRGVERLWQRAGTGRGVRVWQVEAFFAGLATLVIALISPLDAMSADLFSAHMLQHLLLILIAPPLLVVGNPILPLLWALPIAWRRRLGRWQRRRQLRAVWATLTTPAVAWALSAAILWLWHLPVLFQAALRNQAVHSVEHLCLLGTALLFWYVLINRCGRRRFGYGAAVAYVFAAAFQCSILGIYMAFSSPWYPAYAATAALWRLTPAQDQQIAGLLMWIPSGIVYLLAGLGLFARWIGAAEREAERREAHALVRHSRPTPGDTALVPTGEFTRVLAERQ
jgi:putative membrane protein